MAAVADRAPHTVLPRRRPAATHDMTLGLILIPNQPSRLVDLGVVVAAEAEASQAEVLEASKSEVAWA